VVVASYSTPQSHKKHGHVHRQRREYTRHVRVHFSNIYPTKGSIQAARSASTCAFCLSDVQNPHPFSPQGHPAPRPNNTALSHYLVQQCYPSSVQSFVTGRSRDFQASSGALSSAMCNSRTTMDAYCLCILAHANAEQHNKPIVHWFTEPRQQQQQGDLRLPPSAVFLSSDPKRASTAPASSSTGWHGDRIEQRRDGVQI